MKQLTSKTRLKLLGSQLQLAQIDAQARKQAAAVLEVLAGLRTPQQAAHELGLSLPTYFNLETRALRGLTFACCRQAPGRQQSLAPQLRQAQDRVVQLERQLGRYQALLRSAQRSVGLTPATTPKPAPGTRRKPRKATVRALRTIKLLRREETAAPTAAPEPPAREAAAPGAAAG